MIRDNYSDMTHALLARDRVRREEAEARRARARRHVCGTAAYGVVLRREDCPGCREEARRR